MIELIEALDIFRVLVQQLEASARKLITISYALFSTVRPKLIIKVYELADT